MSEPCQLIRYCNQPELARRAAARLLASLIELQADGRVAQLCLTGGRAALATYAELGELVPGSALDPSRLELWWGDERFVPTDGTDRNAGPTLALLARHFLVDPARTHPMPSADGQVDAAASAATYAKELGETRFDLCILGVGVDGEVAAIFPGHPSAEPSTQSVIGVHRRPQGAARTDQLDHRDDQPVSRGLAPGQWPGEGRSGLQGRRRGLSASCRTGQRTSPHAVAGRRGCSGQAPLLRVLGLAAADQ